jgi:hypothetical protein
MTHALQQPADPPSAPGPSTSAPKVANKLDKNTLWKDLFKNPGMWRDYR